MIHRSIERPTRPYTLRLNTDYVDRWQNQSDAQVVSTLERISVPHPDILFYRDLQSFCYAYHSRCEHWIRRCTTERQLAFFLSTSTGQPLLHGWWLCALMCLSLMIKEYLPWINLCWTWPQNIKSLDWLTQLTFALPAAQSHSSNRPRFRQLDKCLSYIPQRAIECYSATVPRFKLFSVAFVTPEDFFEKRVPVAMTRLNISEILSYWALPSLSDRPSKLLKQPNPIHHLLSDILYLRTSRVLQSCKSFGNLGVIEPAVIPCKHLRGCDLHLLHVGTVKHYTVIQELGSVNLARTS